MFTFGSSLLKIKIYSIVDMPKVFCLFISLISDKNIFFHMNVSRRGDIKLP
jgi:hypothetical protein